MKGTIIAVGIATLVVAGAWVGRAAWRSHHKLVTLQVRNAPLSEVVRSLARQTGEHLQCDPKLDAKITLGLKNVPLSEALDQISDQAGARWGRTYAVSGSDNALRRLEASLRREMELDEAGWTNLAPHFDKSDLPPGAHVIKGTGGPIEIVTGGQGGGGSGMQRFENEEAFRDFARQAEGTSVTTNQDGSVMTVTKSPGGATKVIRMAPGSTPPPGGIPDGAGGTHKMRQVMVRRGPNGTTTTTTDSDGQVHTTRTAADGKVLKEDQWSAERLVLDNVLTLRLREPLPTKASLETAAQTAKTVGGKVATYYALEKPPIAVDPGMKGLVRATRERMRGGTNGLDQADIAGHIEQAKQARIQEMSKSPEQQVQRARQKQAAQSPNP